VRRESRNSVCIVVPPSGSFRNYAQHGVGAGLAGAGRTPRPRRATRTEALQSRGMRTREKQTCVHRFCYSAYHARREHDLAHNGPTDFDAGCLFTEQQIFFLIGYITWHLLGRGSRTLEVLLKARK